MVRLFSVSYTHLDVYKRQVRKFIKRFNYIEDTLNAKGLQWEDVSLADMDAIWNEAKGKEK